jgi:hypothetical protein
VTALARTLMCAWVLLLTGCAPTFHLPYGSAHPQAPASTVAWGYSVPVLGHDDLLAYFGAYFATSGEQRCQTNRMNMLAARRTLTATECHPIAVTEGGPLWAISLLNSEDGFVFRSQSACEAGRRENDWSRAGYLPSACTPVSVTP